MPSLLEVGWESYRNLSLAFSSSVFGIGQWNQDDNTATCSSIEFYLDPYNQEQQKYKECAGSDWIVVLIMGVMIHAFSWWGRWFIWEPLAAWNIRNYYKKKKNSMNMNEMKLQQQPISLDPSTKERFGMTMTSIFFHTTSAVFVFILLRKTEWLYSPSDWSSNIGQMTIEPDFKFYYLLYLSRYCSDSISLFFERQRRRDQFLQMLYHHIVTIGLIVCSCLAGYTRYGGVIMFFFDWADLPLLSAKACKYLSTSSNDGFQSMANRLFQVFAVVYTLTRSVMYNFVVYTAMKDLPNTYTAHIARGLLLALAALQSFWLALLYQAIQRQIANGGNVEDIREDSSKAATTTTTTGSSKPTKKATPFTEFRKPTVKVE
eukprot:scaffold2325_cov126-Cylindrotheca_fusiformis.AAC.2